jgi:hypothetical protein
MFSKVGKHINPATGIAFIALIFALTGASFAATGGSGGSGSRATASVSHSSTVATAAKAKPKGKAGPRGPAGPKGATGAPGPAGPAGPIGPAGAGAMGPGGPQGPAGHNGTNGTNGENGHEGKEGKPGVLHPGEKLPAKATEMGAWSVAATKESVGGAASAISFTIPLATALGASEVHFVGGAGAEENTYNVAKGEFEVQPTAACPGTVAEPAAAPGNLCLYQGPIEGVEKTGGATESVAEAVITPANIEPFKFTEGLQGSGTSGAVVTALNGGKSAFAAGTWAVTAK